jgi:acyl-coenzyme A synthetase/AMP-(fatty) acid ligase
MESFTQDGWFKTGDYVEVMENGYFRITGRVKEIINVGGQKVLPSEVESVIMQIPQVADCMVYAQSNAITGQVAAADIVIKEGNNDPGIKKLIRKFCSQRLDLYKVPAKINIVDRTNYTERFKKIRRK